MDRQGTLESPVVSPDGRSLAASYDPGPDKPVRLAVAGIDSGEVQNIYNLPLGSSLGNGAGESIAWSKDGRSVLFFINRGGVSNLWAQPLVLPEKCRLPLARLRIFRRILSGLLLFRPGRK